MPVIPPEIRPWHATAKGNQTIAFRQGDCWVRLTVGQYKRRSGFWCMIIEGDSDPYFLPEPYPSVEAAQEAGFDAALGPEWMR